MTPKRIQMTRQAPWRKENPTAVIVARPTRFGNPYRITREPCALGGFCFTVRLRTSVIAQHLDSKEAAHERAVELFRDAATSTAPGWQEYRRQAKRALAGLDVACWCPLDAKCHGDVLLEIAN